MRGKLSGYFLLSFLSFCFFSIVFHVIAADAQGTTNQSELQNPLVDQSTTIVPTPTIYIAPSSAPLQQQTAQVATQTLPSPTPTIYIAPPQTTKTTPSSTPAQDNTNAQQTYNTTEIPAISPTATPIPTAIPTTQPTVQTGSVDLDALFNQYSAQYSVSAAELEKIAQCESGSNTLSVSSDGTYAGMFQFSASTWASVRGLMGLDPNPDLRENAEEAIHTTAFMLSRGEESAWPNCH
jgi:hypothetical protein